MSDTDDLDEIRERKREQLKEQVTVPDDPIHVDGQAHLDELVADHDVVLVDFYADWCGPCKMLAPVIETLAAETDAAVAKLDVDANQDVAASYNVQGVPTLYLFADGEPVEELVGVQDEDTLRDLIAQYA